ncbi:LPXTG cell wall anchor domain-containing protein, partial [Enterococcus faecalis]
DFIGNKYFVSAIDIDGYIFNEQMSIRNQGGVFTKEDSIINFIYKKVVKPTDPTEPKVPVEPTEPQEPITPEKPVEPQEPTEHEKSVEPVEPATSTDTEKETTEEDTKKEDKKDKLYQTNHSNNNILLALATTAIMSLLVFITFKRFKK